MWQIFAVSLFVSLVTVILVAVQVEAYVKSYDETASDLAGQSPQAGKDASSGAEEKALDATPPVGLFYGQSGDVLRVWLKQGLDIATNFPTVLLTLVAFDDLFDLKHLPPWAYAFTGISLTGGLFAFARPKFAAGYSRGWLGPVSPASGILLLANVAGLVVSLVRGG